MLRRTEFPFYQGFVKAQGGRRVGAKSKFTLPGRSLVSGDGETLDSIANKGSLFSRRRKSPEEFSSHFAPEDLSAVPAACLPKNALSFVIANPAQPGVAIQPFDHVKPFDKLRPPALSRGASRRK
jgi:hypothetical protein